MSGLTPGGPGGKYLGRTEPLTPSEYRVLLGEVCDQLAREPEILDRLTEAILAGDLTTTTEITTHLRDLFTMLEALLRLARRQGQAPADDQEEAREDRRQGHRHGHGGGPSRGIRQAPADPDGDAQSQDPGQERGHRAHEGRHLALDIGLAQRPQQQAREEDALQGDHDGRQRDGAEGPVARAHGQEQGGS